MKHTTIRHAAILTAAVAALLAAAACGRDEISTVNPNGGTYDDATNYTDIDCDRTISIAYSGSTAVVQGQGDAQRVSISGADVVIVNSGTETVHYIATGSSSDGRLKIYSPAAQLVELRDLSLTNSGGAALNLQGAESDKAAGAVTYIVCNGSSTLSDGSTYGSTPDDEDEKGALFAEGSLVFSGSGTLTVTARGKSGVACDETVRIAAGTLRIESSAATFTSGTDTTKVSGMKAKDGFTMDGGTLSISCTGTGCRGLSGDGDATLRGGSITISTTGANFGSSSGGGGGWPGGWGGGGNSNSNSVGAKGMKFDGAIAVSGGTLSASSTNHEAIESKSTISITGGEVYAYSQKEDAINAASTMTIEGGNVCAISAGNDGLDANGNLYLKGGFIYAVGAQSPELAVDANTEGGFRLYVQGGTLVALGGLERNAQLSQACYQSSSWSRSTWYSISVSGKSYAFKTPATGGSGMVVSGAEKPTVKSGVSTTGGTALFGGQAIEDATISGGTEVSLSNYNR